MKFNFIMQLENIATYVYVVFETIIPCVLGLLKILISKEVSNMCNHTIILIFIIHLIIVIRALKSSSKYCKFTTRFTFTNGFNFTFETNEKGKQSDQE